MASDVQAIDLGDPLPNFGTTVYDAAGVLANAGAMALTLTYPDGVGGLVTRTSPADLTITNPSAGRYTSAWIAVALGEHRARWVATGANASAREVVWQVGQQDLILSVDDARAWLKVTKPSDEDELRAMLEGVAAVCELHTRRTWRRTIVSAEQHFDVRGPVRLRKTPVAQVSAVTVNGSAVTDFWVNKRTGHLWRGSSSATRIPWRCDDVTVSYVAGPLDGVIPAHILTGCRIQAEYAWSTQRGGSGRPRKGNEDDAIDPALSLVTPRARQAWRTPRILVR